MTCKDCIYEPQCILRISYGMGDDDDKELNNMEKCCEPFKNKADYAEVKHGEWIWTENGEADYEQFWVCSVCKEKSYIKTKFCSDCGAKMDGRSGV